MKSQAKCFSQGSIFDMAKLETCSLEVSYQNTNNDMTYLTNLRADGVLASSNYA